MCGAAAAAPTNSTHNNLSTNVKPTTTLLNTTTSSNNINDFKLQKSTEKQTLPDPSVYNSNGQLLESFSTIAAAVNFAQSNGRSGDTIMLANGTTFYESGITINENMNFNVFNNGHATIDAQGNGPIFTINDAIVNLNGITLFDGKSSFGGAIDSYGTLIINNCTFQSNIASTSGGAIEDCGNLTVNNTYFGGNTANTAGGAIYCVTGWPLIINNCTFYANSANQGGAIFNSFDTSFTIKNSSFLENSAMGNGGNGYGGAIDDYDGNLNVSSSIFTGNFASGDGGAIYIPYDSVYQYIGPFTVTRCNFTSNTANQGGAIYTAIHNAINSVNTNLKVNNCNFTYNAAVGGNNAVNGGGAIYNNDGFLYLTSCNLTNNKAQFSYGGAIYNNGYDDNVITNSEGTLTATNSTFNNNLALYGGAIYNYAQKATYFAGQVTVTSSNFTNNNATGDQSTGGNGGAIMNNILGGSDGTGGLNISNSTFTNNSAGSDNLLGAGGAIELLDNIYTLVTITGCTFTSNTAFNDAGGAIDLFNGILKAMENTFTDNTAEYGGAIYITGAPGATAVLNFNRIVNNPDNNGWEIYNEAGNVNATLNWWGYNDKDNILGLIYNAGTGSITFNPWIVLTLTANPKSVYIGNTSAITADLLHDSNGKYYNPVNGVVPYTGSANFKTNMGSILNYGITLYLKLVPKIFANGQVTSSLFGLASSEVATVSSTVDDCTVSTPVTVKDGPIAVTSINPGSGATNVPVNQKITVTFSEPNGLPLTKGSAWSSISVKNSNGSVPQISTVLNGDTLTITRVSGTYTPGDAYIVSIPVNAVVDTAGNGLAAAYTSSFTATILGVKSIDPVNGATNVPVNQKITVTFSDPNGLPLTEGSAWGSISVKNSNGSVPQISTVLNGDTLTITRVSGTYTPGDAYIVSIPVNAVVDTAGNGFAAAYTSSFTATFLGVKSIDPVNGATNVPNNQKITVTFAEPIKQGSAYSSISVKNSNGSVPQINTSFSGDVLTITRVSGNYTLGDTYVLNIPVNALTDSAGNTFTPAYTSSFTITTT